MIKCMICGKEMKTLKRHLLTVHSMTPKKYQAKFNGAPVVDPLYSAKMKRLRGPEDLEQFKQNMKYKKGE